MKAIKILVALLALTAAGGAMAHGHVHFGVGVVVGPGWGPGWGPWYYPPYAPYYYPPAPVVVEQVQPPVYIQQPQSVAPAPAAAPAPAENYWYYCAESRTYYPYVKQCAGPWQRVAPQPSPQ